MAETPTSLAARPPLGGHRAEIGGNRIAERADLALVSVAVPLGESDAVAAALKDGFGLAMPEPTRATSAGGHWAIRATPDQLLLLLDDPDPAADAELRVAERLGGAGYVTLQTDAWVILELSGPDTGAAMERLCPLDLGAMPEGGAGRTVMEHMGALVLRLGRGRLMLMSASSSAGSFAHAVEEAFRAVTD